MKTRATSAIAVSAAAALIGAVALAGAGPQIRFASAQTPTVPDQGNKPVKDVVCPVTGVKMASSDQAAASETYQTKTYYFATAEAHTLFDKDPARYTTAADHGKTGKQVFHHSCAGCHGGDTGKGGYGPNLQKTTLSDAAIADVIRRGRGGRMPAVGRQYDDGDMQTMLAYLHFIHEKPADSATPTPTPTPTPPANPPAGGAGK